MPFWRKLLGWPEKKPPKETKKCNDMERMEQHCNEIIRLYPLFIKARQEHHDSLVKSPTIFENSSEYAEYCIEDRKSIPLFAIRNGLEEQLKSAFESLILSVPSHTVVYKIGGKYVSVDTNAHYKPFTISLYVHKTVELGEFLEDKIRRAQGLVVHYTIPTQEEEKYVKIFPYAETVFVVK